MWKLKNYRIYPELWGIALFLSIMLPNFMWMLLPAPVDILRRGTQTPLLDQLISVIQVLMVAATCFLINRTYHPPVEQKNLIGICLSVFLYLFGWIFYYLGITGWMVILILSLTPSAAFVLFNKGRKNGFGYGLSWMFLILHTLRGFLNYVNIS